MNLNGHLNIGRKRAVMRGMETWLGHKKNNIQKKQLKYKLGKIIKIFQR